jgi:hypothetical protein
MQLFLAAPTGRYMTYVSSMNPTISKPEPDTQWSWFSTETVAELAREHT